MGRLGQTRHARQRRARQGGKPAGLTVFGGLSATLEHEDLDAGAFAGVAAHSEVDLVADFLVCRAAASHGPDRLVTIGPGLTMTGTVHGRCQPLEGMRGRAVIDTCGLRFALRSTVELPDTARVELLGLLRVRGPDATDSEAHRSCVGGGSERSREAVTSRSGGV